MGYNTTVIVLNDAIHRIKDDPEFGAKLYHAVGEVNRGKPVDIESGGHVNAATVIETHHADRTVLVAVGGNMGKVANLPNKNEVLQLVTDAENALEWIREARNSGKVPERSDNTVRDLSLSIRMIRDILKETT